MRLFFSICFGSAIDADLALTFSSSAMTSLHRSFNSSHVPNLVLSQTLLHAELFRTDLRAAANLAMLNSVASFVYTTARVFLFTFPL